MGKTDPVLEIDYKNLGTIKLDELQQAIWEDIRSPQGPFRRLVCPTGVRSCWCPPRTNSAILLLIKRLSTGAPVRHLDTHHYHPACLDYKL